MASAEPFIGSIDLWPVYWAPLGWVMCQGQLLQISQYSTLFSIIGTTYGGDGIQTFAVPDMRGRIPVGMGQRPNSDNYILGRTGGQETMTLSVNNMPAHTHAASVTFKQSAMTGAGTKSNNPLNNYPALAPEGTNIYGTAADSVMGQNCVTPQVGSAGMGFGFPILQPYQALYYMIAYEGEFPQHD